MTCFGLNGAGVGGAGRGSLLRVSMEEGIALVDAIGRAA